MNTSKEQLLRKIKELAKQGYGGEQSNAQEILERLMKKYDITDDDLNDDLFVSWYYKLPSKESYHYQLFWQIIYMLADKMDLIQQVTYRGYHNTYQIESPISFKIEAIELYEFYKSKFNEDAEIFYIAFLSKNDLLRNRSDTDDEPSQEEKEKHFNAALMSQGLRKHTLHKQIGVKS